MGFTSHCRPTGPRTALSEKCEKCFWFFMLYAGQVCAIEGNRPLQCIAHMAKPVGDSYYATGIEAASFQLRRMCVGMKDIAESPAVALQINRSVLSIMQLFVQDKNYSQ